jgi:hypothetical protein
MQIRLQGILNKSTKLKRLRNGISIELICNILCGISLVGGIAFETLRQVE